MKTPDKKNVENYLECNVFCPWCGNDNISTFGLPEAELTIAWQSCYCKECGMEWYDEYRLIAISWLSENGDRIYSDEDMEIKV